MQKRLVWLIGFVPRAMSSGLFVGNAIDTHRPVAISGNLHFVKINRGSIGGRHCA